MMKASVRGFLDRRNSLSTKVWQWEKAWQILETKNALLALKCLPHAVARKEMGKISAESVTNPICPPEEVWVLF